MPTSEFSLAPYLDGAELLGIDRTTGCRVYKAELRHLPLLVPLIKEYYDEDPFCKTTGVTVGDDHAWPLAYNGLRYPTSCFGVIESQVVCVTLGLLETKEPDRRLLKEADVRSCFGANHPFKLLDDLEDQFRNTAFEVEKTERCVVEDISYVRKNFRGLKLANFSNICFIRLCMKYGSRLNISRCYALVTSKPSLSSCKGVGYQVIELIPDDLCVGSPALLLNPGADGMSNSAVVRLNFEQARRQKPDLYADPEGLFVYSPKGTTEWKNKL